LKHNAERNSVEIGYAFDFDDVLPCGFPSPTLSNWWNDDQTNARKSKILNYQGTPEVVVGVLDSVICAAILVSIAVTSSEPSAALAHAIAFAFVISA
jgi:hypothetical protein